MRNGPWVSWTPTGWSWFCWRKMIAVFEGGLCLTGMCVLFFSSGTVSYVERISSVNWEVLRVCIYWGVPSPLFKGC